MDILVMLLIGGYDFRNIGLFTKVSYSFLFAL